MKIAISLFQGRISPRFDYAPGILLVTVLMPEKRVSEQTNIPVANMSGFERVAALADSGANVLVCGGIGRELVALLEKKKIQVIPWVTGDAQDALQLFLQGELQSGAMLCPGRKAGRWRFCARARSRRRSRAG